MFTVTKNGANRIDLAVSGKINADDMKAALDELIEMAKDIEHGTMLYDITDIHMPTLGAIGIEISRMPSLFGMVKKFDRCAVLADETWVKKVSEFEGALIPGLEIKAFDHSERKKAEAWLSASSP